MKYIKNLLKTIIFIPIISVFVIYVFVYVLVKGLQGQTVENALEGILNNLKFKYEREENYDV